jgi:DAK2 domain fusion protein YloV
VTNRDKRHASAEATRQSRRLDGAALVEMLRAAEASLAEHADDLDAINVFPVPDGDTGTNLVLTLRGAVQTMDAAAPKAGFGGAFRTAAEGACLAARGNSGVILGQWFQGMSEALVRDDQLDGQALARALAAGADRARAAVTQPVEGTILTAMSRAAGRAGRVGSGPAGALEVAAGAARRAVQESRKTLPVLAEASVVDAGALGFAVILSSMAAALRGAPAPCLRTSYSVAPLRRWRSEAVRSLPQAGPGCCLQMELEADVEESESVRLRLAQIGESVLVGGDGGRLSVHLHTRDPAAARATVAGFGRLAGYREEDIDAAKGRFLSAITATAVVAVAEGEGWRRLFEELGAIAVDAGRGLEAEADAAHACRAASVIIASSLGREPAATENAVPAGSTIWRAASPPRVIAALLAFTPEDGLRANLKAMERAAGRLAVALVEREPIRQDGYRLVQEDGTPSAGPTTRDETVNAAVSTLGRGSSLVTLYYGRSLSRAAAETLAEDVRKSCPQIDVEVAYGGQTRPELYLAFET